ncbi:MAG TPA: hypothetical protein VHR84_00725 [Terriglobales bacterium]|jgi:hypothetical protein|nr:hypothetical protein [Terriglobales bacterium]
MKAFSKLCAATLLVIPGLAAAQTAASTTNHLDVDFLRSPAGIEKGLNHPNLRGLIERRGLGETAPVRANKTGNQTTRSKPLQAAPVSQPCNNTTGTKFNLEPDDGMTEIGFPVSQDDPSVDFIPGAGTAGNDLVIGVANDWRGIFDSGAAGGDPSLDPFAWGFSGTGYYVNRGGGCGADFEGGLPRLFDNISGENLYGLGEGALAVDATRGNVFASDVRGNLNVVTLTLFRTTSTRLTHAWSCPAGTHLTNKAGDDATARACWPYAALIGLSDNHFTINERPDMRADERSTGRGAGDLYLVWRHVDWSSGTFLHSIFLVVCSANFRSASDCSKPVNISSEDANADLPSVALMPNGTATVIYIKDISNPNLVESKVAIRHVACIPSGAPQPPKCSAPTLVARESQPLYGVYARLTNNAFPVMTYPAHAIRSNSDGTWEDIVTWTRCKHDPATPIGTAQVSSWAGCADADVVFTSAHLNAQGFPSSWSSVRALNNASGDQFFPAIAFDRATGLTRIAYYSSALDSAHHRLQVVSNTIPSGSLIPSAPQTILATPNEPGADAIVLGTFFGNRLGIASRRGRTYIHGTFNNFGNYNRVRIPGQDNVLTRIPK